MPRRERAVRPPDAAERSLPGLGAVSSVRAWPKLAQARAFVILSRARRVRCIRSQRHGRRATQRARSSLRRSRGRGSGSRCARHPVVTRPEGTQDPHPSRRAVPRWRVVVVPPCRRRRVDPYRPAAHRSGRTIPQEARRACHAVVGRQVAGTAAMVATPPTSALGADSAVALARGSSVTRRWLPRASEMRGEAPAGRRMRTARRSFPPIRTA